MPKRSESYIKKKILWTLLNGIEIKRGRNIIGYACNLSHFENVGKPGNGNLEIAPHLSRKMVRNYFPEMLELKLITRFKTKNNRDKFHSITPLGLCYLFQDSLYSNDQLTKNELGRIWFILERFANAESIKSIFDFKNISNDVMKFLKNYSVGEFKLLLLNNVNFYDNGKLELVLKIGDDINFKVATIQFYNNEILLYESSHFAGSEYVSLNETQFHSYLANFIIFAIIFQAIYYDYVLSFEFKVPVFDKTRHLNDFILQKIMKTSDKFFSRIQLASNFHDYLQSIPVTK